MNPFPFPFAYTVYKAVPVGENLMRWARCVELMANNNEDAITKYLTQRGFPLDDPNIGEYAAYPETDPIREDEIFFYG